jgi:hypothetical protein
MPVSLRLLASIGAIVPSLARFELPEADISFSREHLADDASEPVALSELDAHLTTENLAGQALA